MGGVKDVAIFTNKDINKLIEKINSLEIVKNI